MGLLPDQAGVLADANHSLDRLGRANGAVPGVTDLSHTLDKSKVNTLIEQFNKMKEEGKVLDAFTFNFMGNQAMVHGSSALPAPPTSSLMTSIRMPRAGKTICSTWP